MKQNRTVIFNICLSALILLLPVKCLPQQQHCTSAPNTASVKLREIVETVLKKEFSELSRYLKASWSANDYYSDELPAALRDLERYKLFSKQPVYQNLCTDGDTVARVFYKNRLTGAIDEFRLETEATDSGIRFKKIRVVRAVYTELPGQKMTDQQRIQAIDSYAAYLAGVNAFAGTILIAKHGEILLQKAYGKRYAGIDDTVSLNEPFNPAEFSESFRRANKNPMKDIETGDFFNLSSLNKIITATAIMQLAEKGKLSLEDSLAALLPHEKMSPEAGAVRLKHLLSHTSGLNYSLEKVYFKPGSGYSYSNFNFGLLGDIIEYKTGMRYEDYIRLHILGPAGMPSTSIFHFTKMTSSVVIGDWEDIRDGKFVLGANPYLQKYPGSAMGGMYSTANDLFRFTEALKSGRLVKMETLALMKSPKPELNAPEYGYGVWLREGPGIWGHPGRLPGADADLEIYGETGVTVILLSNKSNSNEPVQAKIRSLFFPESLPLPYR